MIKYGKIRAKDQGNKRNPNSPARYYYLEHPITIDGQNDYEIEVVTGITNKNNEIFYDIVGIKKKMLPIRTSTKEVQPKTVTSSNNSIPPSNQIVKNERHPKFDVSFNIVILFKILYI